MIENDHDLGYNGTLGWSGSDTSRERAEDEAESGLASARLSFALDLVSRAGPFGLTWNELGALADWHHGKASGVLSNLHKMGSIARLHDRRGRCKIYVTPENVLGRLTERHGRQASSRAVRVDLTAQQRAALLEARDRARSLYAATGGRVGPAVVETLWSDRQSFEIFWRAVSKVVTDNGSEP